MTAHRNRTERERAERSLSIDAWLCGALTEPTGARAKARLRARTAGDAVGARARLQAACCIVLAIGIADDDDRGFEDAAAAILDAGDPPLDDDPDFALLCVDRCARHAASQLARRSVARRPHRRRVSDAGAGRPCARAPGWRGWRGASIGQPGTTSFTAKLPSNQTVGIGSTLDAR